MTVKEAHKILHPDTTRKALEEIRYRAGFKSREEEIKKVEEACIVACEALEKQDAKKVVYYDNCGNQTPYQARCPKCFEAVIEAMDLSGKSYCQFCGQALLWEE